MNALRTAPLLATAAAIFAAQSSDAAQVHSHQKIFDGGAPGQHSFRIPSLVRAKNGDLVAIAECRKNSPGYFGDININFRISTDNGENWGDMGEVVGVGAGSWTNPTAVVDVKGTGRIWLFFNWNAADITSVAQVDTWGERKVYACYSDNNGVKWSIPADMTATLVPQTYTWDTIGPGNGIQLTVAHPGWMVIPAMGRNIYTSDSGQTWRLQLLEGSRSESTVVEMVDGSILRNDRPTGSQSLHRYLATGRIGDSFGPFAPNESLPDPGCQGSSVRYNIGKPVSRIIFLNSSSTTDRNHMTVHMSYDEGATWPVSRPVYDWLSDSESAAQGKGGYSSMIKVGTPASGFSVGALIEINEGGVDQHRSIDFHRFNLEWIRNGAPEPGVKASPKEAAVADPEPVATQPFIVNPLSTATVTPMLPPNPSGKNG